MSDEFATWMSCSCDEYRCSCHDKLAVAVAALQRIKDSDPGPAYYIAKDALDEVNKAEEQGFPFPPGKLTNLSG